MTHSTAKKKKINHISALKTLSVPIGHGFNNEGLVILDTVFSSKLDGIVDGKQIVAVTSDCSHSVARCSAGDSVTSVLLVSGSRDCISVVTTVKLLASILVLE
jgi:hypothetical protein